MSAIDLTLRADPSVLSTARAAIDNLGVEPHLADNLRLIVSELVSNSLRHSGSPPEAPIEVAINATGPLVRGTVTDQGGGFTVPDSGAEQSMHRESGWGLFLVRQIADRWGVRKDGGRTSVWFEIDR